MFYLLLNFRFIASAVEAITKCWDQFFTRPDPILNFKDYLVHSPFFAMLSGAISFLA